MSSAVASDSEITVVFDKDLNYTFLNEAACKQLGRSLKDLIGKCILDIFPEVAYTPNHKNLIKAMHGEMIKDYILTTNSSTSYKCTYKPVKINGTITSVIVKAVKV